MGKIINEIGNKYGKLTVIDYAGIKDHYAYWLCQCDCGNQVLHRGYFLRKGIVKSCGCESHIKNEKGKIYDKLTVIGYDGLDKQGNAMWKCQCECGNIISVRGYKLRNGWTRSCGCLTSIGNNKISCYLNEHHISFISEYSFKDLVSPKGNPLKFDFAIFKDDNLYCLIEYQGEQHYIDGIDFGRLQRETTDILKQQYCIKNNIQLFEIRYDESIEERLEQIL